MFPADTLQFTAALVMLLWPVTLPVWIVLSLGLTLVFARLTGSRWGLAAVAGMTAAAVVVYFFLLVMIITNHVDKPRRAQVGTICWMSRVTADDQGVRIFFQPYPNMIIGGSVVAENKATPRRQFRIEKGDVHWKNGDTEPSLLLKPGEWAPLFAGVENTCRISFDERLGHRGVSAEASFTPPGHPMAAKQFIRAE